MKQLDAYTLMTNMKSLASTRGSLTLFSVIAINEYNYIDTNNYTISPPNQYDLNLTYTNYLMNGLLWEKMSNSSH